MSEPIRCFYIEPTNWAEVWLRRYRNMDGGCRSNGYHNHLVRVGEVDATFADGCWSFGEFVVANDDPRWPATCHCGVPFDRADDARQVWHEAIYRTETGALTTLRAAEPGAMWDAEWMRPDFTGPDGRCLVVRLPGGADWMVDARASNCGEPCAQCGVIYRDHKHGACRYIPARAHERCWQRHGDVPNVTVDKSGGETCDAGAGSIAVPSYHGFLRHGFLETA